MRSLPPTPPNGGADLDLLPAEKASAQAALAQAEVDLRKTVIRAGVSGRVEQFALRVGDIVNPFMRPAGILIPEGAGQQILQAGFGQMEAQIMKVGMVAEATCVSKPWTIIPMVVTDVQDFIAAGQFRGGEQLIDAQQVTRAGHPYGLSRASLQRWARRCNAWQQLHRQRLFQQPRVDRVKRHQRLAASSSSRRGCPRARARHDFCTFRRSCFRSKPDAMSIEPLMEHFHFSPLFAYFDRAPAGGSGSETFWWIATE